MVRAGAILCVAGEMAVKYERRLGYERVKTPFLELVTFLFCSAGIVQKPTAA